MRVKVEPAAITQPAYPSRQQRRAFERAAIAQQEKLNRAIQHDEMKKMFDIEQGRRDKKAHAAYEARKAAQRERLHQKALRSK